MRESDILHETGDYWVSRDKSGSHVWRSGITHSTRVQSFPATDDGLSLAIAYADYRAKRERG